MIPKISVGLSVYNEALTIEQTLLSVKYAYEIIIIDGKYPQLEGSPQSSDGTMEKIHSLIDRRVIDANKIQIYYMPNEEEELKRSRYIQEATGDYLLVLDGDERFSSSWSDFEYLTRDIDEYWCLLCEMHRCVPLFALAEVPRVINLSTAISYAQWNKIDYKRDPKIAFLPIVIQHNWAKGGNKVRRAQQTELYRRFPKYAQGPDRRSHFAHIPITEVKRNEES